MRLSDFDPFYDFEYEPEVSANALESDPEPEDSEGWLDAVPEGDSPRELQF